LYSAIYKSRPGALTKLVTICSREEYSFETAFKQIIVSNTVELVWETV